MLACLRVFPSRDGLPEDETWLIIRKERVYNRCYLLKRMGEQMSGNLNKYKKIWLYMLVMVFFVQSAYSAENSVETISVGSAEISLGSSEQVPISLSDAPNITGIRIFVAYDSEIISVEKVITDPGFPPSIFPPPTISENKTIIAMTFDNPITFIEKKPFLYFTVKPIKTGRSKMEITYVEISNQSFSVHSPSIIENGYITVPGGVATTLTPAPTQTQTSTASQTGSSGGFQNPENTNKLNTPQATVLKPDETTGNDIAEKKPEQVAETYTPTQTAANRSVPRSPGFEWTLAVIAMIFLFKKMSRI